MKKFAVLVAILTLFITIFANAQEVEPRGFEDEPAATATAPATTTAAPEEVPPAVTDTVAPAPAPVPPAAAEEKANPTADAVKTLSEKVADLEKKVDSPESGLTALSNRITEMDGNGQIWLNIVLFVLVLLSLLLSISSNRRRNDDDHKEDHGHKGDTKHTPKDAGKDTGNKGSHAATHAIALVSLLGIGFVSQSAKAACTVTSVKEGGIIVMEQKEATPISIGVKDCTDVKSIQLAASGLTITDVAHNGDTVTAKVKAAANAADGPAKIRITLADGTKVTADKSLSFMIFTPGQFTNYKAAIAATASAQAAATTANATAKKVTALEAKIKAVPTKAEMTAIVDSKLQGVPNRAEIQSAVNPVNARVQELEGVVQFQADEIAMLRDAIDTTALGVQRLAETKKGLLRRPLNSKVAKAMAEVRANLNPDQQ